jgi:hypothetical protein
VLSHRSATSRWRAPTPGSSIATVAPTWGAACCPVGHTAGQCLARSGGDHCLRRLGQ